MRSLQVEQRRRVRRWLTATVGAVSLALLAPGAQSAGTGATSLLWTPATSYTDGTFMVLQNQRIYAARDANVTCGTAPALASFVLVASVASGIASHVYSQQYNGGWYFYATSVDVFGNESDPSNIVCNSININGNWQPPGQGVKPLPPGQLRKAES